MKHKKAPLSHYRRARLRTAEILYGATAKDPQSRFVDVFLIILISLNVLAVILESVASIENAYRSFFYYFEFASVTLFSIEYVARVWSTVDNPWRKDRRHPIKGRIRYMLTWFAIIDVIAIIPFYLSLLVGADLRILRAIRLLRVFKLTRYSSAMTLLLQVFREEARTMGAALFISVLMMFMASTLAYIFEHKVQPEVFSSIPAAMYWATITMTTVGYGDIVPLTPYGKIIGAFIGVIGLGMVALPAGILASGFNSALRRRRLELEEHVQDALEDGEISQDEQENLDRVVRHLNLNKSDAESIIDAVKYQQSLAEKALCPHCKKNLNDPPEET